MKIKLTNLLRLKEGKKKMEEEKTKTKQKMPQKCKSPTQMQWLITTIKSVTEYIHIHKHPSTNSKQLTKIRYSRLIWQTKEIKNYMYQFGTKLTKAQKGKQN